MCHMKNKLKLIKYLIPFLLLLSGCSTNQTTEFCKLIDFNIVNRADLKDRSDIENNNYQFDSLYFEWRKDTLILHPTHNIKNTCAKYSLAVEVNGDTLTIDFVDDTQCELSTIMEIQAKILFKKTGATKIVKYKNKILKRQ